MIVQFRNEKVSNHGSIPITIDCNVVAFIVFEEGFHQPIKRTKQFPPPNRRWHRLRGRPGAAVVTVGQGRIPLHGGRYGQGTIWFTDKYRFANRRLGTTDLVYPHAAKALYLNKHPCLLWNSNPGPTAQQSASLTTIPDGQLLSQILEANSQVQNVKLGGHQTLLSINRLWHELCDMLRRLVGTTAPEHHDCSIQE
ncbi:hypothetical protein TNCV_3629421 [Trichonephila clavipes]|nr:hypothetical protein TNCV_3629421 [Trichonephila clavipes]